MRPTEEIREKKVKAYLALLRELKEMNEIRGLIQIIKRYGLHNTTSVTLQDLSILDKFGHMYYWIHIGEVDEKLARKVYRNIVDKMNERTYKAKSEKPKMPIDYVPPARYKQRYDFAKMHGFGEHSPISKMIKELGNGNYIYGLRLFEIKFKEFANN